MSKQFISTFSFSINIYLILQIINFQKSKFEKKSIELANKYKEKKVSEINEFMKELDNKNLIKLAIQANMKSFLSQDIVNDYITENTSKWFILFHLSNGVTLLFN